MTVLCVCRLDQLENTTFQRLGVRLLVTICNAFAIVDPTSGAIKVIAATTTLTRVCFASIHLVFTTSMMHTHAIQIRPSFIIQELHLNCIALGVGTARCLTCRLLVLAGVLPCLGLASTRAPIKKELVPCVNLQPCSEAISK